MPVDLATNLSVVGELIVRHPAVGNSSSRAKHRPPRVASAGDTTSSLSGDALPHTIRRRTGIGGVPRTFFRFVDFLRRHHGSSSARDRQRMVRISAVVE